VYDGLEPHNQGYGGTTFKDIDVRLHALLNSTLYGGNNSVLKH
jgi:hypothetical protein